MRAIGLAALLSMLFSLLPMHGMEMTLSDALSLLRLDLQQARERASNSESISKRQMSEVERLSSEVSILNADLLASRISREKALLRAQELSAQLTVLQSEVASSRKLSSELATEISALKLDRNEWKARAEWQGKLLRYAPWVALAVGAGGYLVGRLTR